MNKLRLWIYKKTRPKHSISESLLDNTDTDLIHDIIRDKIHTIMKRMKEIEEEIEQMKDESIINKKRIQLFSRGQTSPKSSSRAREGSILTRPGTRQSKRRSSSGAGRSIRNLKLLLEEKEEIIEELRNQI